MAKNRTTDNRQPLLRVEDDPTLAALRAELAEQTARLAADRARLQQASKARQAAEDTLDLTESRVLAGRAPDAALAAAQAQVAETKRAEAIATHALEDTERLVKLLPAAIRDARAVARAAVAATLRAQYAERVAELKRALLAAAEANQAVAQTYAAAREQFPLTSEPHPLFPTWTDMLDLGEAGVTVTGARLAQAVFGPITGHPDGRTSSQLDGWLKEADKLLAAIPQMAQQDKDALAAHIAYEPERIAREHERERLTLEWARADAEKHRRFVVE